MPCTQPGHTGTGEGAPGTLQGPTPEPRVQGSSVNPLRSASTTPTLDTRRGTWDNPVKARDKAARDKPQDKTRAKRDSETPGRRESDLLLARPGYRFHSGGWGLRSGGHSSPALPPVDPWVG